MIRDPLYSAIEEGLSKPLDADAFERCAASLLRQLYPTLVPVPGGGDAGMDGYAADPDARPIVLVTTTAQNVARNLCKNLESHVKSGGRARRALLATSHLLSGRRRVSLQQRASELGFDLIQIFDRVWFVDELYRVTRWRKELLEIPGEQPALSVTRLPACFGVESWHALAGTPHPKRIIVPFHAHHSSLRAWRSL